MQAAGVLSPPLQSLATQRGSGGRQGCFMCEEDPDCCPHDTKLHTSSLSRINLFLAVRAWLFAV